MRRPRLAPSESLNAISGRRAAPRASSRLARFAQAISSSTATAASNAVSEVEKSWRVAETATSTRVNFETLIEQLVPALPCDSRAVEGFQAGLEDCVRLRFRLRRSDARFQRPNTWSHMALPGGVSCSQSRPGNTLGCIRSGSQRSGCWPLVSPMKPGGATPMMVRTDLRRVNALPSTSGLPPKRPLPVVIADDGIGRVGAVVAGGEYATDRGTDP